LTPLTPERKAEEDQFENLRNVLEESVKFYQYQLTKTPAGKPALDYLVKRGISQSSIERFELGYAPHAYEALINHLNGKGYSFEQLQDAGLVVERDSGGYYDKFRNRIMFPIRDGSGKMTGFGARILDPEDIPKFLNSPQTALFNKSRLLYGLNLARKPIRDADQVVIVEGYLDVIALHQSGFENTVSPMGTAMNEDQLRYLKKFTRRIVLALDADAAGEKATLRGLDIARQALDRETELVFDARGLLHHEARLQADVRVTMLPEGCDPDDVVLKDPQAWKKILENAKPIVVHVMDALASGQNLEDAKVKSSIAAQVIPLIEDVPNPIERDTYRQQLARLLKVDERSLLGNQKVRERTRRQTPAISGSENIGSPAVAQPRVDQRSMQMENHCLSLLFNRTERLYELERALKQAGLERFTASDFDDSQNHTLARLLLQGLRQDEMDVMDYIQENTAEELSERLTLLASGMPIEETNEEKIVEDLYRTVVNLRLIRTNLALNQLRFLEDEESTDEDKKNIQLMIMQNTIARGKIDHALVHTPQKR
jgi:DNA primase